MLTKEERREVERMWRAYKSAIAAIAKRRAEWARYLDQITES